MKMLYITNIIGRGSLPLLKKKNYDMKKSIFSFGYCFPFWAFNDRHCIVFSSKKFITQNSKKKKNRYMVVSGVLFASLS